MFIGTIHAEASTFEDYPAAIKKALDFLRSKDFTKVENGRIELEADNKMYAVVQRYETRDMAKGRPETHKKYIDIQYIADGQEYMGWCPFSPDLKVSEAYNPEKDVAFYEKLVPESNVVLAAGSFAVLYPDDVHRPCVDVEGEKSNVTKVVVKISLDLL
ncbi:MAG: YhcH/YjgK/YiaL family protein [Selenomonadaceae bacterium]|nr:YhcH/YjgK/YiaL family protein [Selenomonadaceae bacterium]MBR3723587.1 YhcH/YjgK/YiaL family protein [Selenomonadaceae bacterium]